MGYLTPHFHREELIHTSLDLDNDYRGNHDAAHIEQNLVALCFGVLEPLRERVGSPIQVTSGFRTFELNTAIGGSSTSAHMTGQAADVIFSRYTGIQRAEPWAVIVQLYEVLPIDQAILYEGKPHIHLGIRRLGDAPRHQLLIKTDAGYEDWWAHNGVFKGLV